MHDLVIDNARIIDGLGAPERVGGVAVTSGRITEIGPRELSLTAGEASALLRNAGLTLGEEDVAALYERTEGWPAGLYLAALWLRDLADPSEGVRAFAGSHRAVADSVCMTCV